MNYVEGQAIHCISFARNEGGFNKFSELPMASTAAPSTVINPVIVKFIVASIKNTDSFTEIMLKADSCNKDYVSKDAKFSILINKEDGSEENGGNYIHLLDSTGRIIPAGLVINEPKYYLPADVVLTTLSYLANVRSSDFGKAHREYYLRAEKTSFSELGRFAPNLSFTMTDKEVKNNELYLDFKHTVYSFSS